MFSINYCVFLLFQIMAPVKERMKKSREKKKSDPEKWNAQLEKERERDKQRRIRKKEDLLNNLQEKAINREKVRARVKLCRERKKLAASTSSFTSKQDSPIGTYKCVQSFGKAVNKVKRTLPESPHKKSAVLQRIVTDIIGPEGTNLFNVFKKKA